MNSNFRQEALKGYILAILGDGVRTPTALTAAFAKDLRLVLDQIANQAGEQAIRKISGTILGKVESIAQDIGKRGFASVWSGLMDQYKRGVEVNSRRKRT